MAEKLYSLKSIHDLAGDDEAFIIEMVTLFTNITPTVLDQMDDAIKAQNYDTLQKLAHSLKANVTTYHIKDMQPVIQRIELLAMQKQNWEEIGQLHQRLNSACRIAIAQMREDYLPNNL